MQNLPSGATYPSNDGAAAVAFARCLVDGEVVAHARNALLKSLGNKSSQLDGVHSNPGHILLLVNLE